MKTCNTICSVGSPMILKWDKMSPAFRYLGQFMKYMGQNLENGTAYTKDSGTSCPPTLLYLLGQISKICVKWRKNPSEIHH